ncbi:MAG: PAS domain S-box protein [Bacteroidota bacterium]
MNKSNIVSESHLPKWVFMTAIVITMSLYMLVIWYVWESKKGAESVHKNLLRQQELSGTIKYLDEVLTLSARMAAATGDDEWETRYRNYVPTLNDAINEAMALTRGTSLYDLIIRIDTANRQLVYIENRVFENIRQGKLQEAKNLLTGEEYSQNKRIYSNELSQFTPMLQQQISSIALLEKRQTFILILVSILSVGLLLFTWLRVRHLVTTSFEKHVAAQAMIRSSETELRALFSSMNDVILVLNREGRYLKIAPTNPSLLFKPPNELIGKTVFEIFSPAEADFFYRHIQKALDTRKTQNIEYKLLIQGTEIWFAAAISSMSEDTVVWVARDVTERKRGEEILKESEQKFRTVSDTVTSAIFIYQNDKFKYVNKSTEIISGYSSDELLRMNFWEFVHPEFREMVKKRGSLRQQGIEVPPRYEFKIITKNHEERWIDFAAAHIEYEGKPAALGTAFDITERKRVEQLQSAVYQIAETANTTLSLNDLFPAVHAIIRKVMPANNFYIALYDQETETLSFPYFVDEADITPPKGPAGRGLTAYVLRKGASLLCDQARFDEILKSGEAESVGAASPIWLGVPLIVENRTIGAMVVQHYSDPSVYTTRDQRVLEFVSSEVGRVIDRKWTEEKLRESEERYRRLVDLSPDGIAVHIDGKVVFVNRAMVVLLGAHTADEIIGKPVMEIVHPESREVVLKRIHDMLVNGAEPPIIEEKFIRLDGTPLDVEVAASPFVYQGRKAIQVVVRNITERKRAEEAIRRSEEKYRDIFTYASVGIYQSTIEGKFLTANLTLAKMLGYDRVEDLLQCNLSKDIYWDVNDRTRLIKESEPTGVGSNQEVRWKKRDGTPIWIQLNAHSIKDKSRHPIYFEGFVLDITERIRAQEALQLQTSYYQQLFENSPAGIAVVDGYDNILNTNRAFEKMFQFLGDEVRGKRINELIVPEALQEEASELSLTSQQGQAVQRETIRKRKDGTLINVALTGYPILLDKEQVAVYGMYIDITQEKKLEENLRQAQKMESLGTLAGGIAHDFNNLLAIIMGHAALLEQKQSEDQGMRKSVETITKATQRGAGLVRQLLTFARKSDILLESVNVNETIVEISKLLTETFPKTITIVTDLSRNLRSIVGDANQIHQMLLNLCVNARDAMPKGGTLKLETKIIPGFSLTARFPQALAPDYVQIDISDSGIGMDQATKSRVFEPFFTTKERGKGTGLGLATVYGIVESHSGFIDVESKVNQGTIFHIYFPVQPRLAEDLERREKIGSGIQGGNETILIIEDEEILRDLLKNVLTDRGYTVCTAEDGYKAIDIFEQRCKQIDLVISDMGLPKMGGQEVFYKLVELDPSVKVLLASGFLDPSIKISMFKAGAKGFIQKPYSPDEVLLKIRDVLD